MNPVLSKCTYQYTTQTERRKANVLTSRTLLNKNKKCRIEVLPTEGKVIIVETVEKFTLSKTKNIQKKKYVIYNLFSINLSSSFQMIKNLLRKFIESFVKNDGDATLHRQRVPITP